MVLLNSDAKKEIAEIISGISRDDRPILSSIDAIKMVALYPSIMILSNVFIWVFFFFSMVNKGDNAGQDLSFYIEAFQLIMSYGGWISLGVTGVVSVIFALMFFSTALMYLSIPKEIREKSRIICSVKSTVRKIGTSMWVLAVILTFLGMLNHWGMVFAGTIPTIMFLSIFIIHGYLGVQSVRYGLGPLMATASNVFSKNKS
ncbi:hypothetical protein C6560_17655 [Enterobacter sp. FS01]|nr:hypothetical protein C6560_17655 [Enterobacter sp. FS01]